MKRVAFRPQGLDNEIFTLPPDAPDSVDASDKVMVVLNGIVQRPGESYTVGNGVVQWLDSGQAGPAFKLDPRDQLEIHYEPTTAWRPLPGEWCWYEPKGEFHPPRLPRAVKVIDAKQPSYVLVQDWSEGPLVTAIWHLRRMSVLEQLAHEAA